MDKQESVIIAPGLVKQEHSSGLVIYGGIVPISGWGGDMLRDALVFLPLLSATSSGSSAVDMKFSDGLPVAEGVASYAILYLQSNPVILIESSELKMNSYHLQPEVPVSITSFRINVSGDSGALARYVAQALGSSGLELST